MGLQIKNVVRGMTALELLIYLAFMTVMIVFATPILSKMVTRSNVDQAIKTTEESVEQARRTARFYKTEVTIQLEADETGQQYVIRLSIPAMQNHPTLMGVQRDFPLPDGIQVFSQDVTIHFDAHGQIESPVSFLAFSDPVDDRLHQFLVE